MRHRLPVAIPIGLLAVLVVARAAAIIIAPTAVYIDHRSRAGSVELHNPGAEPEEVTIETVFGYPATDSLGRIYVYMDPDSAGAERSAATWIRPYPRRATVPPGRRQAVRLLAQPPADLPDGEYWTRLVVTSRIQQAPLAGATDTAAVRVGLTLQVRTVISVTYRKGRVTTGVTLTDFAPEIVGDSLILRPRLTRNGEAAYIGALRTTVRDSAGTVRAEWTEQVAVYYELYRRFAYDVTELTAGAYWVHVELSTERGDILPEHRLPAAPVADSARVRVT